MLRKKEMCDGCCYRKTCDHDFEKCCYLVGRRCIIHQQKNYMNLIK